MPKENSKFVLTRDADGNFCLVPLSKGIILVKDIKDLDIRFAEKPTQKEEKPTSFRTTLE